MSQGTELGELVAATQAKGRAFVMAVGTVQCPGSLIGGVTESAARPGGKKVMWAMTMPPGAAGAGDRVAGRVGDDLTRRGGLVGPEAKAMAVEAVGGMSSMVRIPHSPLPPRAS